MRAFCNSVQIKLNGDLVAARSFLTYVRTRSKEAQLSQRDRATPYVSWNLSNCCMHETMLATKRLAIGEWPTNYVPILHRFWNTGLARYWPKISDFNLPPPLIADTAHMVESTLLSQAIVCVPYIEYLVHWQWVDVCVGGYVCLWIFLLLYFSLPEMVNEVKYISWVVHCIWSS